MNCPALYRASVMHLRRLPDGKRTHQFRYRVFRLWLDLDKIDETAAGLLRFSHNRFNLLSLYDRDHGPRDGSALRAWVDGRLAEEGIAAPAQVFLYTFPRLLGYTFNPLSAYIGYDATGRPSCVLYEVRNTDTDISHYAFDLSNDAVPYRHATDKNFYVSPFIDADQRYSFTLDTRDETFSVRIRLDKEGDLTMIATENAYRCPLDDKAIRSAVWSMPFMTFKIIVGIYWEAVRLRLKGAHFYRHPGAKGRYRKQELTQPDNTPDGVSQ